MNIGDLVRIRSGYRQSFDPELTEYGIVTSVNRVGNVDILTSNHGQIYGVFLGNLERVDERKS